MRRQCCQVWGVGSSQVSCSQFSHEDLLVMWSYLFQMQPNMREDFQKKLFCFYFVLARISQFDTRQTTSPITGPTIQRHSQFVFPCSCSSSGTLLPLQESCHVNLLSFSATWSSEVIGADCEFFQLTQCGVFLTFEENSSTLGNPIVTTECENITQKNERYTV